MTSSPEASVETGVVLKRLVALGATGLGTYLLFELRSLIVPVLVSGLLAYVFYPLVTRLERLKLPRDAAIALLLAGVSLAAVLIVNGARSVAPSEGHMLELRVRALYKLNTHYKTLMGLGQPRGNRLYQLVGTDLDPVLDELTRSLALTPEEHAQFLARVTPLGRDKGQSLQLTYDQANAEALRKRAVASQDGPAQPAVMTSARSSAKPGVVRGILSRWAIAPLVFYFLLRDTGEIKRGLLALVPNRLFEPALNVLADLDKALGDYVRGVFLECGWLGLTVGILLTVVGVPLHWAMAIGIVSGASNVIPYVGSAIAMLSGLGYALLAEDFRPLLPWVNSGNLALWVVAAVALAELLKSVIYEPFVLGGRVKLHPLVMGIGAVGGATLFGPVGMLLAIPAITTAKVLVSSSAKQLKAYGLV